MGHVPGLPRSWEKSKTQASLIPALQETFPEEVRGEICGDRMGRRGFVLLYSRVTFKD